MRPRSWHARRGRRSGMMIPFLLSRIFSREQSLQHYTKNWVLLSGGSFNTKDIIPSPFYILISTVNFGDEQDIAANNGFGLNQMENLVVLYQQTDIWDTSGTYQKSILINQPQRSTVPLEGLSDFCNLLFDQYHLSSWLLGCGMWSFWQDVHKQIPVTFGQ